MKNFLLLALIYICFQSATVASPLDEAIALHNLEEYVAAKEKLNEVFATDPENMTAKYYNAFCSLGLGDELKFLNSAEKLKPRYPELTYDQQEEMDRRYITLSYSRRAFDDAKAHADDFKTSYTQSVHADEIERVFLLASYEYGYKKAWDAKNWSIHDIHNNTEVQEKNWQNGTADLKVFLDGYANRPSLFEELSEDESKKHKRSYWKACVILEKNDILAQLAWSLAPELREEFDLVSCRTLIDFFPENSEMLLSRVNAFSYEHSTSGAIDELRRHAANQLFRHGSGYLAQHDGLRRHGNMQDAQQYKQIGTQLLSQFKAICDNHLLDVNSGILEGDRGEIELMYLRSLFLENEFNEMLSKSRQFLERHERGSTQWGYCRVYEGIGLMRGSERDMASAKDVFDSVVLEVEVVDRDKSSQVDTLALFWAAHLERTQGDQQASRNLVELIKEMPESRTKQGAMKYFGVSETMAEAEE